MPSDTSDHDIPEDAIQAATLARHLVPSLSPEEMHAALFERLCTEDEVIEGLDDDMLTGNSSVDDEDFRFFRDHLHMEFKKCDIDSDGTVSEVRNGAKREVVSMQAIIYRLRNLFFAVRFAHRSRSLGFTLKSS